MSALRKRWDRLVTRHASLSRRERIMVAVGLIAGPILVGNLLFIEPQAARQKLAKSEQERQRTQLGELQVQVQTLQQQLQNDPDSGRKAELAALQTDREALDRQLLDIGSALVRPQEMNALLEHLLVRHAGLRLLSLKTLAPESLTAPAVSGAPDALPLRRPRVFDLYRHGVEIRLEGSYGELQAYVEQLEAAPQRIFWGELEYRVVDYPRAEMRLVVYTLSPEHTWLAL